MSISRSYAVRRVGVVLGLFIGAPGALGAIYSNDFEGTVGPEWSTSAVVTAPGGTGTRFLGRFGSIPCIGGVCCPATGSTLTLTNLPPHEGLTIEFDLYVIRTWDGNGPFGGPDGFSFSVDGQPPLLATTFTNLLGHTQDYPTGSTNLAGTGASATNTLGYTAAMCGHTPYIEDSTYHLTFTVAHSGSQAVFQFGGGPTSNQYCDDEFWGLDNVSVTAIAAIPTVSEWGMVAMAGLMLLAGGVVIARRRAA